VEGELDLEDGSIRFDLLLATLDREPVLARGLESIQLSQRDAIVDHRADVASCEEPYDEVKGTLRYAQGLRYLTHRDYSVGGVPLRIVVLASRAAALDLNIEWGLSDREQATLRIVDDPIEGDSVEGGNEDAALVEEAEEDVLCCRTDQPAVSHS
jgi:hypothetical protein